MSDATVLDVKGLNCPLPVLRVKKALKPMEVGARLKVLATDPGAVQDMEAFCRQGGHVLEDSREDGGVFEFLIRKGA